MAGTYVDTGGDDIGPYRSPAQPNGWAKIAFSGVVDDETHNSNAITLAPGWRAIGCVLHVTATTVNNATDNLRLAVQVKIDGNWYYLMCTDQSDEDEAEPQARSAVHRMASATSGASGDGVNIITALAARAYTTTVPAMAATETRMVTINDNTNGSLFTGTAYLTVY